MRNRDGLYKELEEVIETMRGISPKLSLYKRLEVQKVELMEKLGGMSTSVGKPEGKRGKKFIAKYHHVHG